MCNKNNLSFIAFILHEQHFMHPIVLYHTQLLSLPCFTHNNSRFDFCGPHVLTFFITMIISLHHLRYLHICLLQITFNHASTIRVPMCTINSKCQNALRPISFISKCRVHHCTIHNNIFFIYTDTRVHKQLALVC